MTGPRSLPLSERAEPEVGYIPNPVANKPLLTAREAISAIAQLSTALEVDGLARETSEEEMEANIGRIGRHTQGQQKDRGHLPETEGVSLRPVVGVRSVSDTEIPGTTAGAFRRTGEVLDEPDGASRGANVRKRIPGHRIGRVANEPRRRLWGVPGTRKQQKARGDSSVGRKLRVGDARKGAGVLRR